jgi:hypothetical protein
MTFLEAWTLVDIGSSRVGEISGEDKVKMSLIGSVMVMVLVNIRDTDVSVFVKYADSKDIFCSIIEHAL